MNDDGAKNDHAYLLHILDCANRVLSYTSSGQESFIANPMIQDAVMRNLEVIGEAVKHLSDACRERNQSIPWKQIAGMRDVLIHHYFGVKLETVWNVVESHLPGLRENISQMLEETDSTENCCDQSD